MGHITPIGCDVRVQVVIVDNRYLRWRCTHHHCPDVIAAKAQDKQAYHVYDTETGTRWTEFEDRKQQAA